MADEDVVLTFGADLSQVQAQLAQFQGQLRGNPVGVPIGAPAIGGGSPHFIGGQISTGWNGGGGLTGGGFGTQAVQSAGSQLAATIQQVTQQVRAAGSGSGGGIGIAGPGSPWSQRQLNRAWASDVREQIAAAGSGYGAGFALAAAGGSGDGGGGGNWTQADLNRLAAVNAARTGGIGGGAAAAAAGGRFGSGLSRFRGLFYSLGAYEVAHSLRGSALAQAQAQFADSPTESLDADIAGVDASTSGVYGGFIGLGADLLSSVGIGVGPNKIKQLALEAKARSRAVARLGQAIVGTKSQQNIETGGRGSYGSSLAGIGNAYLAESESINEEAADASASQDPFIKSTRLAAVGIRRATAAARRAYAIQQLNQDVADDMAGYADQAAVAGGRLSTGSAQRNALLRRFARSTTDVDRARDAAELSAFDASEGYRIGHREYAAQGELDEARLRYQRQPNVARALGIYNQAFLASEDATRQGSSQEALLIRQSAAYNLAGFRRQLIEGGQATYESNPAGVDFGQAGSSGRASIHEGDDMKELNAKVDKMIELLGGISEEIVGN